MLDSFRNGDWLDGSVGKLAVDEKPKALVRIRSAKPLFALTVNGFSLIERGCPCGTWNVRKNSLPFYLREPGNRYRRSSRLQMAVCQESSVNGISNEDDWSTLQWWLILQVLLFVALIFKRIDKHLKSILSPKCNTCIHEFRQCSTSCNVDWFIWALTSYVKYEAKTSHSKHIF